MESLLLLIGTKMHFHLSAEKYDRANTTELDRKHAPNCRPLTWHPSLIIIRGRPAAPGQVLRFGPLHRSTLGSSLLLHNCA